MARTEKELLNCITVTEGLKLLEVGCGEGGNLFHVADISERSSRKIELYGVDMISQKLHFGRARLPNYSRLVCADAYKLPFIDSFFDIVFCRDLLHHVLAPEQIINEMHRVCKSGGDLIVIEPNGLNPLILLLALLQPAELELIGYRPGRLLSFFRKQSLSPLLAMKQPFPFYRALLHPMFGFSFLFQFRVVDSIFAHLEALVGKVFPTHYWAYMRVTSTVQK